MRRLNELAGAALGTAHSAVGGSQEPFDRLMTASTRYRLDVRPAADGTKDVAAKVTAAVAGAGLSVKVRPYFVPPSPRASSAAATPDARLNRALAGTPPEGERLAFDAAGYLATLPEMTMPVLGEVRPWQLTFFAVGLPGLLIAALMATVIEPPRRGMLQVKTATGEARLVVVPSPSWPFVLRPQHDTAPVERRAHAKYAPASTSTTPVSGRMRPVEARVPTTSGVAIAVVEPLPSWP